MENMKSWKQALSGVLGLGLFLAVGASSGRAEGTNELPHFQEVFRLLRANLSDVSEEDLNRAAVKGLLSEFYPRVVLAANLASTPAETTLVSKIAAYDQGYGYLRVTRATTGLADQIKSAYEKLSSTNALKGVVLDLRFADGDDYTAAGNAADRFLLKEQPLLSWGESSVRSTAKTDAITIPVAVLVNQQTVGAAEALAAVLREADAAVLVGARTAGQAHVFKEFTLANGQQLRIATGQVQVGKGKTLSASGVSPDIEVKVSSADEKAYFEDAFKVLFKPLVKLRATNSLAQAGSTNRAPRRRINEAELVRMQREGRNPDEEDLATLETPSFDDSAELIVRDPALARALDLLKGIAVVQRSLQR